jgi:hypothetical protein
MAFSQDKPNSFIVCDASPSESFGTEPKRVNLESLGALFSITCRFQYPKTLR